MCVCACVGFQWRIQIPISFDARRIKSLEGQKIYDVYYWEEVIQEDGDGGKVVVCRKKTEVRRSEPGGDVEGAMESRGPSKVVFWSHGESSSHHGFQY